MSEYKKQKINKALRKNVWENHSGQKYIYPCYCCQTTLLNPFDFECGHIVAESKGGNTNADNLRPVCTTCNKAMGTKNMEEFITESGFRKRSKLYKIFNIIIGN
jgi:5-methylcytosine-specific restriction endonuclease McrA